MKIYLLSACALLAVLQTGCVTGRRTVALPVPSMGPAEVTKGDLYIGSVVDNRHFENKPSDPSVPSIDGDVTALTPAQQASMIGRQRNTYGHAMGDVALPGDQSVTERTKVLVAEAFKQRGYKIVADSTAHTTATVSVDQFWGWFTPGFVNVSFEARVYCTITLKRPDKEGTLVIKGYGLNKGQVASDANWALAYDRAFVDFLDKARGEIDRAGF